MKKLALLLAVVVAFCMTAVAQGGGTAPTDQSQTTTTTKTKTKTKKSTGNGAAATKEHTLTGCLAGPNDKGDFTLTNGKHKKGVDVAAGGDVDLKAHAGHEVKLTGTKDKTTGKFTATKLDHISDTCTATAGAAKKGGKTKTKGAAAAPKGY